MRHMVIHCIARSQVPKGSRYIYAFEPRVAIDGEAFNCKKQEFLKVSICVIIAVYIYVYMVFL